MKGQWTCQMNLCQKCQEHDWEGEKRELDKQKKKQNKNKEEVARNQKQMGKNKVEKKCKLQKKKREKGNYVFQAVNLSFFSLNPRALHIISFLLGLSP